MEPNLQDKRKRNAIILALVSCAVLVAIVLAGSIAAYRSVQSMQSNTYDSIPIGHVFSQVFGLETKNMKDAPENTRIFQRGCRYFLQGVMSDSSNKKESAISSYLQSLDQFKQYPGWNNSYADAAINRLACDYDDVHNLKEAETWYQRAITCAADMSNKKHRLVALAYQQLGEFYSRHYRYDDSIKAFQSALAIDLAGAGPTADRVGYDYWWLGSDQQSKSDDAAALESLQKAISIGRDKWKYSELGDIALSQIRCAYDLKDNARAKQYDDQALEFFGSHDDIYGYYSARLWRMSLLRDAGKTAEADDLANKCFPSNAKIKANDKKLSNLWSDFAQYYVSRSNYPAAEHLWREQLAHNESIGRKDLGNALLLGNLANCLSNEHKMDESAKVHQRIIKAFHDVKALPPEKVLNAAIKVFQAKSMTTQIKSAQADLREITSKDKEDADEDN